MIVADDCLLGAQYLMHSQVNILAVLHFINGLNALFALTYCYPSSRHTLAWFDKTFRFMKDSIWPFVFKTTVVGALLVPSVMPAATWAVW